MTAGQPKSPLHEESVTDRLIREAMEAGEFDDLPGAGKPIPGAGTSDDDGWWIREWVRRNREPDLGGSASGSNESSGGPGTPHSGTTTEPGDLASL